MSSCARHRACTHAVVALTPPPLPPPMCHSFPTAQDSILEAIIGEATSTGRWVVLQHCDMAPPHWMEELEQAVRYLSNLPIAPSTAAASATTGSRSATHPRASSPRALPAAAASALGPWFAADPEPAPVFSDAAADAGDDPVREAGHVRIRSQNVSTVAVTHSFRLWIVSPPGGHLPPELCRLCTSCHVAVHLPEGYVESDDEAGSPAPRG